MARPSRPPGKVETLISIAILLGLAAIAAALVLRQINYSSAFLAALDASTSSSPEYGGQQSDLSAYAGADLTAMSPQESFNPDDLYEKIDGRADLYLSAGFVSLRCQRLAMRDDPNSWLEVFVYGMGNPDNAFTVFSKQRRPGVQELGELAYQTANSLHFAHGKYYVEIVAASPGEQISRAMREYRQRFSSAVAGSEKLAREISLFPTQHLRAGSISRCGEDDFGIKGFAGVYLAVYEVDGTDVTAFLSRRVSAKEAADMATAYMDFFRPFGAKLEATGADIPGGSMIVLLDTYKIVFSRGRFVAGVHESTSRQAAEKVAAVLSGTLAEAGK